MKRKIQSLLVICFCAIAFGFPTIRSAYAAGTVTITYSLTYGQTEARSMLSMINAFRTGSDAWYWNSDNSTKTTLSGLSGLTYDYELEKIAMQRAAEIAVSYSHTRPNGNSWTTAYTSTYSKASNGENIAAGYNSGSTAAEIFALWQETNASYSGQGHRRNMLSSKYKAVGIAHVVSGGVHYWVQEFSSVKSSAAETTAQDSAASMKVVIAADMIQNEEYDFPESFTFTLGESMDVPGVTKSFSTTDTWPETRRFKFTATPTVTIADESIVSLSDGKLIAQKIGTTTVTLTAHGESREIPVTVNPIDLSAATVELEDISCIYTRGEWRPAVISVVLNGNALTEGVDYIVSYTNNINAGTADVVLTGAGNYNGTCTKSFVIQAKPLSDVTVSAIPDQTYTGAALTPEVTVRDGDVVLAAGTDYTVSFANNVNTGTAAVTVSGMGNYSGTAEGCFRIVKKVKSIRISGISHKIAAGKKIQLKATVTPSDASDKKITWKTNNSKVATVNSRGLVTVKKNTGGKKVTIRAVAKDGSGVSAKYVICSMKGKVKKITASNMTIKAGKTAKIKVKVKSTSGANKTLTYTSSNKKYATVSSSGKVKARKKGRGKTVKITIRATDGSGKSKTIKVKIK